jgi:hypothetical protein
MCTRLKNWDKGEVHRADNRTRVSEIESIWFNKEPEV